MIEDEGVSIGLGVPTLWVGLIRHLRASGRRLSTLLRVIVGGTTCPRTIIEAFQDEFGIEVRHAWGMTEMSALGTIGTLNAKQQDLPASDACACRRSRGGRCLGSRSRSSMRRDGTCRTDGCSIGEVTVRGPWVCGGYYEPEGASPRNAEGWFATGNVASIDADGYLQITDRQKDLIKCAGEWVSSVEIESLATEHPAVIQAAVIGIPDAPASVTGTARLSRWRSITTSMHRDP